MNFRIVAGEDAESCRHSCICSYYTVVLSSYGHTCTEPHTQNKHQQLLLLPYQSAKQAARTWLSENHATWVLPNNPTDRKPRNKKFSQCCTSRNQTLNQKKSSHDFSTCKTFMSTSSSTEIFLSTMKLIKEHPKANTWSMPHQANPQTKKKLPWTTKAVSTYYMAKEKYPPLLSYGLQVGAACVVGAAASVKRGANIIDMATKHTYTLSLKWFAGGKKTETKQKDLDSKHKQKKRNFLAKCAIRCDALEETSSQRSENECLLQTRNPRKPSPKETRSSEAQRRCRQDRKASCIPPKWCRPTLPGGNTLGYVLN